MVDFSTTSCSARVFRLGVLLLLAVVLGPTPLHAQNQRQIPFVTSRFLPEALAILRDSGFVNVEIARVVMDDMPQNVVLRQFPDPSTGRGGGGRGGAGLVPVTTQIWLVVVEPLPVLADLVGWRADRALVHVRALHSDLAAMLDNPQLDSSQHVVTAQSVPAGPAQPPDTVLLTTGPLLRDTVFVTDTVFIRDTAVVTDTVLDTVFVRGPTAQSDTVTRGVTPAQAVVGGIVLTVAGLGLGMLACRTLRGGTPQVISGRRNPRKPGRKDSARKEGEPDLPDFTPVIVDEAVWSASGRVRRKDQDTREGRS